MPIVKLTPSFISNELQCPNPKKRIEYCDDELPGLYVEVRSTRQGQGTYYLRYKDSSGKTCHQKIGRTVQMSLTDARKQVKALKAEIALGADPRAEDKARKAILTFKEFFDKHYLPYVAVRKRSWKRDEELYRLRIKDKFGNLRLNQISRQQIMGFHTELKDEGLAASTCNHHIKLLRHAFNLAVEWELLDKNPVTRVSLFNEDNKVEHYLDEDELDRLLTILRTDSNRTVCRIAIYLLSTGARLNEVLQAKWSQVDLKNRVWRIPASNSKSKRVRAVPLNDSAIAILSELDTKDKFDYLFINHQSEEPYTTIHKVWMRIRKAAKLPHLRIHDLRHQYASFPVNSGRSLYEVQQILGHSDPSVTTRYAHLSTKSLHDAANSASVLISQSSARGNALPG